MLTPSAGPTRPVRRQLVSAEMPTRMFRERPRAALLANLAALPILASVA